MVAFVPKRVWRALNHECPLCPNSSVERRQLRGPVDVEPVRVVRLEVADRVGHRESVDLDLGRRVAALPLDRRRRRGVVRRSALRRDSLRRADARSDHQHRAPPARDRRPSRDVSSHANSALRSPLVSSCRGAPSLPLRVRRFPRADLASSRVEQPFIVPDPHLGARLGRQRGPERAVQLVGRSGTPRRPSARRRRCRTGIDRDTG